MCHKSLVSCLCKVDITLKLLKKLHHYITADSVGIFFWSFPYYLIRLELFVPYSFETYVTVECFPPKCLVSGTSALKEITVLYY